ncbi:MAG: DUF6580 family putative transport protein, partial [Phycisphaerae bacterium]
SFAERPARASRRAQALWHEATLAFSAGALGGLANSLAVWAFGGIYPTTTAGLGRCFAAALPFFRYTISGDLIFAAGLFGTYALARHWRRPADFKPLPSAVTA